jgi:hypothetical protein
MTGFFVVVSLVVLNKTDNLITAFAARSQKSA